MEKRKMKPGAFLRRYIRVIAAGVVLLCIFMMAFFAPVIATHDPMQTDMYNMNQLPNEEHIMGTDCYGRDLFSRIVYGSRMSLSSALRSMYVPLSSVPVWACWSVTSNGQTGSLCVFWKGSAPCR